MASQRLRVGIIGCGNIGLYHARAATADPRLELAAYADTRLPAAQSFLEAHGGEYVITDAHELINHDSIDIVVIATHHDSHVPLSLAAAAAGRHILLEKPMATTAADAQAIADAVMSAGVGFAINYKFRLDHTVRSARDSMPDPRLVIVQLAMPPIGPHSDDHWVFDPVRGGGLVTATGTHLLDLLSWICRSEPVAVSSAAAMVVDRPAGLADITVGSVEFDSGVIGSVVLADAGDNALLSKWSCQIYDGVSSVVLHDRLALATYAGRKRVVCPDEVDVPASMLASLADSVLEGGPTQATATDGVRAVKLANALDRSAALHERVILN